MKNSEHVSKKEVSRDEFNMAQVLGGVVNAVHAYYTTRNEEDTEADPDTLKNIADELIKVVPVNRIENLQHLLSFVEGASE